jgi:hypothetical protein
VASIGDQGAGTGPVLELGEAVGIGEKVGTSGRLAEKTDMGGKRAQEGLEGAASFSERLAMTLIVAGMMRQRGKARLGRRSEPGRETRVGNA